jgi:heat shock protein HtpX
MSATGLRTHIWSNNSKSLLLLAAFPLQVGLIVYAGLLVQQALGFGLQRPRGITGESLWSVLQQDFIDAAMRFPATIPWVLAGVGVWFLIAWLANVKLIGLSTGAETVSRKDEPELYNLVENLCISRGRRMPRLQIIETDALNAYASGVTQSQYTVAVTRGLMETLDRDELEAVLAHELAHIEHGDVRLAVVAAVFVGIFSFIMSLVFNHMGDFARIGSMKSSGERRDSKTMLAGFILIIVAVLLIALVRVISILTQMAISRRREFMADAGAVVMTKNPEAMISALQKISGQSDMPDTPAEVKGMYFDNGPGFFGKIFSTHPPIPDRIGAVARFGGVSRGSPWGKR